MEPHEETNCGVFWFQWNPPHDGRRGNYSVSHELQPRTNNHEEQSQTNHCYWNFPWPSRYCGGEFPDPRCPRRWCCRSSTSCQHSVAAAAACQWRSGRRGRLIAAAICFAVFGVKCAVIEVLPDVSGSGVARRGTGDDREGANTRQFGWNYERRRLIAKQCARSALINAPIPLNVQWNSATPRSNFLSVGVKNIIRDAATRSTAAVLTPMLAVQVASLVRFGADRGRFLRFCRRQDGGRDRCCRRCGM